MGWSSVTEVFEHYKPKAVHHNWAMTKENSAPEF